MPVGMKVLDPKSQALIQSLEVTRHPTHSNDKGQTRAVTGLVVFF